MQNSCRLTLDLAFALMIFTHMPGQVPVGRKAGSADDTKMWSQSVMYILLMVSQRPPSTKTLPAFHTTKRAGFVMNCCSMSIEIRFLVECEPAYCTLKRTFLRTKNKQIRSDGIRTNGIISDMLRHLESLAVAELTKRKKRKELILPACGY